MAGLRRAPEKAIKAGKQLGAQYVMYGRLSDDVQKNGDTVSRDYLFTLRAANIETGRSSSTRPPASAR